jgi:hypothetical protein
VKARAARLAGLVLALVIGPATGAGAVPILEQADAEELAAQLTEAREVQGICYGWQVNVFDEDQGRTLTEIGSSRGVGQSAVDASCPRFLEFRAELRYTSSSSESEDSASFHVFGNVSGGPDDRDLRRVGITEGSLVGANDDLALINAVQALPALVAERGLARPVQAEPTEGTIPAADRPTDKPGSDWTRANGIYLAVSAVLVLGGLGWAGYAWLHGKVRERQPTED